MKLSDLQQSPNLLLDALQNASGTMVASATSITDPLPQTLFSDSATVTANLGPTISLMTVADTTLYKRGSVYTFTYTGVTNAMIPFAIVQPSTVVVNWLGAAPAQSTVGVVGLGSGTVLNDSYRLNQGNFLIANAMQRSTDNLDFLHVIVKCRATSLVDLQAGLGTYFFSTNAYDPNIGVTAPFAPVAIRLVNGEYEVEYVYRYDAEDVINAQLANGSVSTTLAFTNMGATPIYLTSVKCFTRPDASLILEEPYEFLDAPLSPSINSYAGDINLGVFYLSPVNTSVNNLPSPIKSAYWELATDNLFNATSVVGVLNCASPIGNSGAILTANIEEFDAVGAIAAGTLYLRARVYNEVGIASAWSATTSFTYTPSIPVLTVRTTTNFSTGDVQIDITETNFSRTQPVTVSVVIEQQSINPTQESEVLVSINSTFDVGIASQTVSFSSLLPFYELDGGIVLSVSQVPANTFFDGVNIPIYTTRDNIETQVSKNYTRPQQYVPFVSSYSGNPNVNTDALSLAAPFGQFLFDNANNSLWVKSFDMGIWKQIPFSTLRKKQAVSSAGTYTLLQEDLGASLIFNEATPIIIEMSGSFADNLPELFNFNFRNTDAGTITLRYTFSQIEGSGTLGTDKVVTNSKKLNSAYLETRGNSAESSVWVAVGDFV